MKTPVILLALIAFASSIVIAQETKIVPKAQIGGIALGFKRSEVEQRLGKPLKVIVDKYDINPELRYDGITIWFWDEKSVVQIISTNSKHCVTKNVCPGAKASTVQKELGAPQQTKAVQEGRNSYSFSNAETCWLNVIVERAIVKSLELTCQP